jgi:hypothetical protein
MGIVRHWCQADPDSDSALRREQDEGEHQADLLGGVDCRRGDTGFVAIDAEGRGGE